MLRVISAILQYALVLALVSGVPKRQRSLTSNIVWCATPMPFEYDLQAGAFCDKPVELTSTLDSYAEFDRKLSTTVINNGAIIKYHHINKYYYGDQTIPSQNLNGAYTLLKWAIMHLKPNINDLWLEFGVNAGGSINITSLLRGPVVASSVYGFDTFQGLPETWNDKFIVGAFNRNGKIPTTEANVKLIVGLFNQTLEPFLREHPNEKIGFVNIDMDLYKGAYYVLNKLIPRFQPGTIVHFHEFFSHNSKHNTLGGEEEMRALYYVLKRSTIPVTLQLMPFQARWREPLVFRVL